MPDFELVCADCAETFIFDENDQQFYRERKMRAPRRCKPCRYAHRLVQTNEDGMPVTVNTGKHARHEAECDKCGKTSMVPFKPAPGRSVLCFDCYNARRAALSQ